MVVEAIESLGLKAGGTYVDLTFGGGGRCDLHAKKIQQAIGGDIVHTTPQNSNLPFIGDVYTKSGKLIRTVQLWQEHYAIRKGCMMYDRITGPAGMHIDDV